MKKLLILVLIGLLLALSIFIVISGVQIGKLEILGIEGIQKKNTEVDNKIKEAGKLVEKDYKQSIETVKASSKKLEQEKKTYEDMISAGLNENGQVVATIQEYDYETLLVKLGNYVTNERAKMKMDVLKSSSGLENSYDLRFTVTGSYVGITMFISDIENDSQLGFKIEEFKMQPSSSGGDLLDGSFVCKEILIKGVVQSASSSSTTETTNNTNTNTNNTNQKTNNTNTNTNNTNQKTNNVNTNTNNTKQ